MTRARTWAKRADSLLTRERLLIYPMVITILFVVVWGISFRVTLPLPDHVARWTAGHLLLEGVSSTLYDPVVQSDVQAAFGGKALSWFVSPPYVAVAFVPFGMMPYQASAAVWTVVSVSVLFWSLRILSGLHPSFVMLRNWRVLLIVASCQPVLELIGGGQDSAIVLGAMVCGAALLAGDRPFASGLVLSCTVIKPQLAVLVPIALVLGRSWRALAGAIAGGLLVLGLTSAVLGSATWEAWREALASPLYQREVVEGQAWKSATLKGLSGALAPMAPAWMLNVVWLVLIAGVLVATGRRLRAWSTASTPVLLVTMVPLVTVLVTPHAMVYDLVLVVPTMVWLVDRRRNAQTRLLVALAYTALFLAPLLHLAARNAPWPISTAGAPWVVVALGAIWWTSLDADLWSDRSGDTRNVHGEGPLGRDAQ